MSQQPYEIQKVKLDLTRKLLKQMLKEKISLPALLDVLTGLILQFCLKGNIEIEEFEGCLLEAIKEYKRMKGNK